MSSGFSQAPESERLNALVQAAFLHMRERRLDEAAQSWNQVLQMAPGHPQALFHLAQHLLYRKDPLGARKLLERAALADPRNPAIPLNLAFTYRAVGDGQNEMAALTRSLTIDPYFYPALLAKGMLLERSGSSRKAAKTYKDVLTISPPEDQLTGEMLQAMRHAREVVEENAKSLDAYLDARLKPVQAQHSGDDLGRVAESKDIAIGSKKVFTHRPSLLHFPRLPAIAFYDRADFPWLKDLEAATGAIRAELLDLLREDAGGFRPYISHPEGAPVDQWAELNNSMKWNALFLWKDGVRDEENCRRCPRMAALMDTLPMIDIPNYGPTVLFSVLEPHAHIPAHTGSTNVRLIVHLPLIVPPGCRFRVANETREWREGEAWVFDDTIDHEAWNDSDEKRVIVMIDIWNPLLTRAERAIVSELLNGLRDYYASE